MNFVEWEEECALESSLSVRNHAQGSSSIFSFNPHKNPLGSCISNENKVNLRLRNRKLWKGPAGGRLSHGISCYIASRTSNLCLSLSPKFQQILHNDIVLAKVFYLRESGQKRFFQKLRKDYFTYCFLVFVFFIWWNISHIWGNRVYELLF